MELTEYIRGTNNCIAEISKSHPIIIVDEEGNETNLSLKCLTQSEENIVFGWCQTKPE